MRRPNSPARGKNPGRVDKSEEGAIARLLCSRGIHQARNFLSKVMKVRGPVMKSLLVRGAGYAFAGAQHGKAHGL